MKAIDTLPGNDEVKKYLIKMAHENKVANSLLFAGPNGVGKNQFAQAFAELLLGTDNHPDLHHYYPEGKLGLHSIDTMRQFSQDVYMAPFQGNRKVFIIHQAERMLSYSSNALLKTFEEPPADTVIILISSVPDSLLPTILSRCCIVRFMPLPTPQRTDELRIITLKLLANGKLATIKELAASVEQIAIKVEELRSKEEESYRKEHLPSHQENFSAAQIQGFEKELDGIGAVQMMNHVQGVFEIILGWYRDLHLLQVNGKRELLIHFDFESELEQCLQKGECLSLEKVQEALVQAKTSLERSTSLKLCLETLFLQLNLV